MQFNYLTYLFDRYSSNPFIAWRSLVSIMPLAPIASVILIILALSANSHAANEVSKSDLIIVNCKDNSANPIQYSICLDEAIKSLEREVQAWETDIEAALEKASKKTGNTSSIVEYTKASRYYSKYMESQCRSVFFKKQSGVNAAELFRHCKIKKLVERSKQLELDRKNY